MSHVTLYYKPFACSLGVNILLAYVKEKGKLDYEILRVDLATHKLETGEDYYKINPRGAVPALEVVEKGKKEILTQNHAILLYIGDKSGIAHLSPEKGTIARARLDEALAFCSDLHGAYSPLLHPERFALTEENVLLFRQKLEKRLGELEKWLPESTFWLGKEFTQADVYVSVILSWSDRIKMDLMPYPKARALKEKVFALPATTKALALESGE
ncbi:glutathione S-transferase [Acetobacteraceae bacterium]|nr:glutathione S-transferase [Acetobacteraceae bacterium]